jgi:PAS domain S-box-containing protein
VRTTAGLVTSTGESFETSLAIRREEILLAMTQVMGRSVIGLVPDWAEQLLDAFSSEVMNKLPVNSTRSHFLFKLDNMLHQVAMAGGDMALWQNVLSTMRCQLLPCLGNKEMVSCAENLWHRAQMRIGGIAQRVQMYQKYQARQQAQTLRKIEHRLITTFDINGLMDILAEELPWLGIPGCYLSLYETRPEPVEGNPQPAPEWSRLILAYNENGRIELEPGGRRFLSRQLVPEGIFPQERFSNTIIEPLYFQENQLGFVLFEVEAQDRRMCDALRGQISSALQGALLVQQVKAHEAELVRKQYILDIFMENVPDRIYFKDCDGRITRANKSHALRFGLSNPAEEIGKTDFDLFTEEDARSKYQQEQEIIRTGRPLLNVEEHTVWPDGRVDWSLSTKMPLRDEHGEIIGTFGISRDITALKQAEHELWQYRDHLEDLVRKRTAELTRSNARLHEEIIERRRVEGELIRSNARLHDEIIERRRIEHVLRVSEQQYRVLAENVKDGIVIVQHGKLVFANMISATITGYPPEHLIGIDPVSLFQVTDKQSLHTWLKAGSDRSPEPQRQVELITRDGNTIWTEIVQSEIVWNGQPAILLTIRDITDRKLREQHLEEERVRLQQENISLRSTIKERYRFGALVGKSPAMQRVYELILSAATSDVNVLVYGESGTGKELIARTLHQLSWRKTQAFVPVNCASIPETLFEREFFGHHKGAFTGADRDKSGLFDRAHQGILFLDEVTELSPGAQAKLLRVLQDGEYTPLGSNTPKQADVLLIAATNKEYQMEIKQGRLRKDFFYRICVIEISVPPLQERKEDLPLLIEHILEQYRRKQAQVHGSVPLDLPADQTMLPGEFVQALYAYHWPGNVRELQNVVQRYLATQDLTSVLSLIAASGITRAVSAHKLIPPGITLPDAVKAFEKQMIADTLAHNRNHTGKTAKMLGIPLRTLQYKINSYRLKETG